MIGASGASSAGPVDGTPPDSAGWTLLELILASSLMLIVVGGVVQLVSGG